MHKKEDIIICGNKEQVESAPSHAVLIVNDYRLVLESDITALVECTGNTAVSSEVSADALKKGINVYTLFVCWPALRALEEGLEDFAGCAVVISHDRWFLDRICTHIDKQGG